MLKRYAEKEELIGPELMREMERVIMLNVIDNQWKDHLLSMDHLKEGIGMRAYGQKDPLIEYKKESFVLFQDMMDRIEDEAVRFLFFMQRSDDDGHGGPPARRPERPASRTLEKTKRMTRWKPSPPPSVSGQRRPPPRAASRAEFRHGFDAHHPAQERKGIGRAAIRRRRFDHRAKARDRERQGRRTQRPLPVRKREEVQKMPRSLKIAGHRSPILPAAYAAQPKPPFSRIRSAPIKNPRPKPLESPTRHSTTNTASKPPSPPSSPVPIRNQFSATAWRLHDSTGALALFEAPPAARSDALGLCASLAVHTSDGMIFVFGNYVFQFTGGIPDQPILNELYTQLARVENCPLPALSTFLPQDGLVANSERYILGPVSLQRVEPAIPPSVAGFRMGAEAQFGKYQTPKGLLKLVIFDYPTPSMAREQAAEFQKIPGAVVKRTGPLVAATLNPPDPDAAERILGKINYQANVTLNETDSAESSQGAGQDDSKHLRAGRYRSGDVRSGRAGLRRLPNYVAKNVAKRRDGGDDRSRPREKHRQQVSP